MTEIESTSRLETRIGSIVLKNPIICGAGEHTMTGEGIRAALATGVAAVVAKSVNESAAAKEQLDKTDYALFDSEWNRLPWNFAPPADATLFSRSGLIQREFGEWIDELAEIDAEAARDGVYVIPSIVLSGLDQCVDYARRIEQRGLRILEVNIGAPHGEEAFKGAIVLERDADRVEEIVKRIRAEIRLPLWIKLTGQSENVAGLAAAARRGGADAVILTGRFMGFLPDLDTQAPTLGTSAAIGGGWALPLTARWLVVARKQLGPEFPLIATNGARNGLDIARFLLAGAAATELASVVFTAGYRALAEALAELDAYLVKHGKTAHELLGVAADRAQSYQDQCSRAGYWQTFVPPTR